jgi:uncharacterized membrane protein YeaQ/YmgE (transglycosylase-associated protein family)
MLMVILSWLLCGLIVGFIARLLVGSGYPMGIGRTTVLGIVGAFVGGLLHQLFFGVAGEPFSFSTTAWQGWILSIIGAVIVLLIYTRWKRNRSWW